MRLTASVAAAPISPVSACDAISIVTLRIKPRRLPAYVERKRERQATTDTADRKRYKTPIDAHLAAQRMALDGLEHAHQQLADGYTSTRCRHPTSGDLADAGALHRDCSPCSGCGRAWVYVRAFDPYSVAA
jgi:hypothetical protein